jgi:hypothetical protein
VRRLDRALLLAQRPEELVDPRRLRLVRGDLVRGDERMVDASRREEDRLDTVIVLL